MFDPKPRGDAAYDLAMAAVIAHDRFLAANPELFLKATSVADIDRARAAGQIAVFYLFKAESTIWLKGKRVVDEDDDGHLDGE